MTLLRAAAPDTLGHSFLVPKEGRQQSVSASLTMPKVSCQNFSNRLEIEQPSLIGSGYNFPANFVLGTLTAGIASFVSAPLLHTRNIVARTYFTQEHTSQIRAIQNVYKKFGIRAFFKTPHFYTYCFGGSYLAIFGVLKEIFDF